MSPLWVALAALVWFGCGAAGAARAYQAQYEQFPILWESKYRIQMRYLMALTLTSGVWGALSVVTVYGLGKLRWTPYTLQERFDHYCAEYPQFSRFFATEAAHHNLKVPHE